MQQHEGPDDCIRPQVFLQSFADKSVRETRASYAAGFMPRVVWSSVSLALAAEAWAIAPERFPDVNAAEASVQFCLMEVRVSPAPAGS